MESKTTKTTEKSKSNSKPKPVVHMQPDTCPGQEYFARKERDEDERLKRVLGDVLGDVPKYMRMAGDNRIWLWLLTFLALLDTAMIVSLILTISKIPKL